MVDRYMSQSIRSRAICSVGKIGSVSLNKPAAITTLSSNTPYLLKVATTASDPPTWKFWKAQPSVSTPSFLSAAGKPTKVSATRILRPPAGSRTSTTPFEKIDAPPRQAPHSTMSPGTWSFTRPSIIAWSQSSLCTPTMVWPFQPVVHGPAKPGSSGFTLSRYNQPTTASLNNFMNRPWGESQGVVGRNGGAATKVLKSPSPTVASVSFRRNRAVSRWDPLACSKPVKTALYVSAKHASPAASVGGFTSALPSPSEVTAMHTSPSIGGRNAPETLTRWASKKSAPLCS